MQKSAVENCGKVTIDASFNGPFVNVLWTLLTGERFQHNDPSFSNLLNLTNRFIKSGKYASNILGAFPWLMKWAPKLCGFEAQRQINQEFWNYFQVICANFYDFSLIICRIPKVSS